jgi:hypothetical protein
MRCVCRLLRTIPRLHGTRPSCSRNSSAHSTRLKAPHLLRPRNLGHDTACPYQLVFARDYDDVVGTRCAASHLSWRAKAAGRRGAFFSIHVNTPKLRTSSAHDSWDMAQHVPTNHFRPRILGSATSRPYQIILDSLLASSHISRTITSCRPTMMTAPSDDTPPR